jgi:asparagine synthase (glutamine-hydrolysing)
VDRASMAHGLECRSPLLDQELVEFTCSLPPTWKVGKEGAKLIFKDAASSLLPPEILKGKKMGFSVPIGEWFRNELRPFINEKLIHGPLARMPLVRIDQLKIVLEDHYNGKRDRSDLIWNFLMLSLWLEQYGVQ